MEYPRELNLDADVKMELISYLNTEIDNHDAERGAWVSDLKSWQEDYWATPSTKEATFPYKGAANLVIPLTAIAVESVHAREMTTLFALDQMVSCKINPKELQDAVYDLDRAIDKTLLIDVDIYNFFDQALLTNKKLGTCVGKSGWEKIVKTAVREIGGEETDFEVITKQGPTADPVPLANFIMPFTATDPQESPWCGEEHLENIYQIRQKIKSNFFGQKDIEKDLEKYYNTANQLSSAKYTDSIRSQQNQTPMQWPKEIGWREIWLSFNVDGNKKGIEKEIVVHYHRQAQTFFSIRYNWNTDLRRPYRIGKYFPVEHRWAGIGIGKQNEQFQAEVTTQHRQRIDNATLANLRMYKVKQGIGIGPNEPLFPGKIWLLDEMDDVQDMQMGEIYPSAYNNEQQAVIYSQQRSGVNELTMGMPQVGTPGTATGDLTRVQEGSRKFDYTYKNTKRFAKEIILDVLCNQSQFGFRDRRYFDSIGINGTVVSDLLTLPCDEIRNETIYSVNLVGQSANKLVDRSNWTQFSGMLTQYYTQILALCQQVMPQLYPIVAAKAFQGGTEAMKQIGEGFDIRGLDRFLIPDELIAMLLGQSNGKSGPMGLIGGANQSTPGNEQDAGVPSTPPTP